MGVPTSMRFRKLIASAVLRMFGMSGCWIGAPFSGSLRISYWASGTYFARMKDLQSWPTNVYFLWQERQQRSAKKDPYGSGSSHKPPGPR